MPITLVMFCRDKSAEDHAFGFFDEAAVATSSTFIKPKTQVLYFAQAWDSSEFGRKQIKCCGINFSASYDGKSTC